MKDSVQFRLVKIQPENIPNAWDLIKEAMEIATVGGLTVTEESLANLLQALLAGRITAWIFYKQIEDEKGKILGLLTTTVTEDTIVGIKHLLLYSMSGFNHISDENWKLAFSGLAKYARAKGCKVIRCITNSERVLDVAEMIGADVVGYTIDLEV